MDHLGRPSMKSHRKAKRDWLHTEGKVKTEVATGAMQLSTKERQQSLEARRNQKLIFP